MSASAAIGRLTKKIQRQLAASTIAPPITGPAMGASSIGMPTTLITRPMRRGPAACRRIVWPTGMISPAPAPWMTRAAISDSIDVAAPARHEPTVKRASDAIQARFVPKRALAQPLSGIVLASASRYAVRTHWIVVIEAWKSPPRLGIATLTMVASRIAMTMPITTTPPRMRVSRSRCRALRFHRAPPFRDSFTHYKFSLTLIIV